MWYKVPVGPQTELGFSSSLDQIISLNLHEKSHMYCIILFFPLSLL